MRQHWEFFKESDTSMGVFYPLHYVLAAFETKSRADEILSRFLEAGFAADDVAAVDGPFLADKLESTDGSGLVERAQQGIVRWVGTEFGYIDDDCKTAFHDRSLSVVESFRMSRQFAHPVPRQRPRRHER